MLPPRLHPPRGRGSRSTRRPALRVPLVEGEAPQAAVAWNPWGQPTMPPRERSDDQFCGRNGTRKWNSRVLAVFDASNPERIRLNGVPWQRELALSAKDADFLRNFAKKGFGESG